MMGNDKKPTSKSVLSVIVSLFVLLAVLLLIIIFPNLLIVAYRFAIIKWFPELGKCVSIDEPLSIDEYINQFSSIISCFVTAALTFAAFRLSKSIATMQMNSNNAEQMACAHILLSNMEHNLPIITSVHILSGSVSLIVVHPDFLTKILTLFSSNLISQQEKDVLIKCFEQFETIVASNKAGKSTVTTKEVSVFVDNYIDINHTIGSGKYKPECQQIIDHLKAIAKEG